MRRGGGLPPATPHWWRRTKRPRATAGGLIVAGLTNVSCGEGLPPCLRTSPALCRILGVQRTSRRSPFPRHASGVVLVFGFRGALVSHNPPGPPKARRL